MNPKAREFENDGFLKSELCRLIKKHGIQSVLETGTEYGGSANAFSLMHPVKMVVTMDIEQKFGDKDLLPSVLFFKGDSRVTIKWAYRAIESLQPTLFFLDAHTSIESDECPLRTELIEIRNCMPASPPVLVIHDCFVPGKPQFGFDTYRGQNISWENVKDLVPPLYPNGFEMHYNTEAEGSCRGCLFIEPV